MRRVVLAGIALTAACEPIRPPPSFAPDPGLVEQIREVRMSTSLRACPGESFGAAYTAVLNDGSLVPFETRYDKDNPPRLHVVFLARSSPDATPLEGGGRSAAHAARAVSRGRRASPARTGSRGVRGARVVLEVPAETAAAADRAAGVDRSRSLLPPRSRSSPDSWTHRCQVVKAAMAARVG